MLVERGPLSSYFGLLMFDIILLGCFFVDWKNFWFSFSGVVVWMVDVVGFWF